MLNRVELIGNLGADPEMREAKSGMAIGNLRIATTHRAKDKDGVWTDMTEWHRVVCFGKLAENCERFLNKGRQVFVDGRIQTRKWDDKDGNTRYSTEIVATDIKFLGGRGESDDSQPRRGRPTENGHSRPRRPSPEPVQKEADGNWDEEIPF